MIIAINMFIFAYLVHLLLGIMAISFLNDGILINKIDRMKNIKVIFILTIWPIVMLSVFTNRLIK